MRFEKNERLQHLLLILLMDITILGVIIISGFSSIYAATNHKARIEVVGANPAEVQWFNTMEKKECVDNPNDWLESYTLGEAIDVTFTDIEGDSARRDWIVSANDFQGYGPLTGISVSSGETILQFVKASDKSVGLTKKDFTTTDSFDDGNVWITSDPDGFVLTSIKNSYALYGLIKGAAANSSLTNKLGGSYYSIQTQNQVTDTFDHVITLYFNGAEDAPVIPYEVQAVIDAIDEIREITEENYLSKENAITAARNLYEALETNELKEQVTNYNTLTAAEAAFDAFKLAAAKAAAIKELNDAFDKRRSSKLQFNK